MRTFSILLHPLALHHFIVPFPPCDSQRTRSSHRSPNSIPFLALARRGEDTEKDAKKPNPLEESAERYNGLDGNAGLIVRARKAF
jgi:hypothetical protein